MGLTEAKTNDTPQNLQVLELHSKKLSEIEEIKSGLNKSQKVISPKYFYDAQGSELFNKICKTSAYYQTKTETSILSQNADKIGKSVGKRKLILEPGAGNMQKVRLLIQALNPVSYIGIDVSKKEVIASSHNLALDYPSVDIVGVVGDFDLIRPSFFETTMPSSLEKIAFFPGSTIGNFEPSDATEFLKKLGQCVGLGGFGIIGVDLTKPKNILNLAYNDPEGYTSAFNLNLLARLNRDFGSNFKQDKFTHLARYNNDLNRIEMHLVSSEDQSILIDGESFEFNRGETIHTENSYKYSKESFFELLKKAGFVYRNFLTDTQKYFGLAIIEFRPGE